MSRNTTTDKDMGFNASVAAAKSMKNSYVDVGYWGPKMHEDGSATVVYVASIHEFGTKDGHIPERSFIRSTADANKAKYKNMLRQSADAIMGLKISVKDALAGVGEIIASDVQAKISSGIPPPLSEYTKKHRRHGGETPLIDTGMLRASISTRVIVRGAQVEEHEMGA